MRKGLTTLMVILLAVGAMLVSCKAEVGTPADELVSVSFEEAASRSITATLETFNKDAYYWKYAAEKADDSGLTSGATVPYNIYGALPVSQGNPGLGSGRGTEAGYKAYKVAGFSQGQWNFKLWAYKTNDNGVYKDLVFYGEAKNVTLTRGGDNTASVVVNPVSEGDGYIKIGEITFIPKKQGDKTDQTKSIEVTNPDGSAVAGLSYDSETKTYTVPAGAYKVTVKFTNAAQTIVYGEGYVIATVYSGLTTTIGGNLNELITYAQFDADLNPDAVNVQAESAQIQYGFGDDVEIKTASTAKKEVKTTVARSDANAIITEMAAAQAVDTGASTKLKLTLNVDPTDASEQSVTYEIGMKATLTYTKASETQTTEKPVTSLTNYVIVEIEMSSGLSSVTVKHSGTPMYPCTTKGQLDTITTEQEGYSGFYFYDPAGTLYIKTRTFSPFEIKYEAPKNYVAEVDGVKYGTLAEAVAQVKDAGTSTVKLLADVALTSTIETTKTFALNLNGFNITADGFRAIHVKEGTLTLAGEGIITANGDALASNQSVIRVGDNSNTPKAAAGLVIGEGVTITSNKAYGVTVFGNNVETDDAGQTLDVYGKIKVTGTASAISGNGNDFNTKTAITINAGAEVSAENDYAIFHPQGGKLLVVGGSISGKGGIEAKGAKVMVSGGVITATAPEAKHDAKGDGPSTSGYALVAVSNDGYKKGPGSIEVTGGTIIGPVAEIKDFDTTKEASLALSGGTYTVDPTAYAVEGCQVRDNKDGTWTILSAGEIAAQLAIAAGADPDSIIIGSDYAYGTLSDNVVYKFYANEEVYVEDASKYNGYDGSETVDPSKYTVGKLLALKKISVTGFEDYPFNSASTITTLAFAGDIEEAFKDLQGNFTIKNVDLTNLTVIPNRLLYMTTGVTSVTIPSSVTRIEDAVFQQSEVSEIVFENGCAITSIPNGFAYQAPLTSITIPETVTSIGAGSIRQTAISAITIPAGVRYIGSMAFRDCDELVTIDVLIDSTEGLTIETDAFSNVATPYPKTTMNIYNHDVFVYITNLGLSSANHITFVDVNPPQAD